MDEAWIDLTETGVSMDEAKQIADVIRLEIMYSQGLSASVGVSDNYIFSKLGSDYKKPNATTVISKDNYQQIAWPLPQEYEQLSFLDDSDYKINIETAGLKI